ncbi:MULTISPECIES: MBL fold metallo-hydrolase [Micrococcaceae]|nr:MULTISPECIES: MBL fold metallo-hydrolase [Micrococcaceae]PCC24185.1 MBL fold metallo-hydrolase [Glutamicibacter sp. BW78]
MPQPTPSSLQHMTSCADLITAPNPGPMTLEGTNSYLLHAAGSVGGPVVVVDPGPAHEGHLQALAAAGRVELILITHRHPDHTEGIDRLHELTGAPVRAARAEHCRDAPILSDGEVLTVAGVNVQVVATPGHTSDSLCFLLLDDGHHGSVLTGDTILGRGTTILDFPDGTLGDYLASLDVLSGFGPAVMLPAHGPMHPHLGTVIEQYASHRLQRLEQVREAVARLTGGDSSRQPGAGEVTDLVYAEIDPAVRGAAEHSVKAQLHYLSGVTPAP